MTYAKVLKSEATKKYDVLATVPYNGPQIKIKPPRIKPLPVAAQKAGSVEAALGKLR